MASGNDGSIDPASDYSDEFPLTFSLALPSLKELSLLRISRCLWVSSDRVRRELLDDTPNNEEKTKTEVLQLIPLLPLPEPLLKRLNPVVHYLGTEFFDWLYALELDPIWHVTRLYEIPYIFKDKVEWTAYGTIDRTKMVKLVLREDGISLEERYDLACKCCFEDEIARLWAQMSPVSRRATLKEDDANRRLLIPVYWSYKMMGQVWDYPDLVYPESGISSPEEYLLEETFGKNYSTFDFVLKYFWPKLSPSQRDTFRGKLGRGLDRFSGTDALEFLFSLLNTMGRRQQIDFLRLAPALFLEKCLNRPWQYLFFPILKAIRKKDIDQEAFFEFLTQIDLTQCDDSTIDRVFVQLRPFIDEYVYDDDDATLRIAIHVIDGKLDFVKRVMSDAPVMQKLDVISRTFQTNAASDYTEAQKALIMDWASSETWPTLKRCLARFGSGPNFERFLAEMDAFFTGNEKRGQL